MKRLGLATSLLAAFISGAFAQGMTKPKSSLTSEVAQQFPDNVSGAITPTGLRLVTNDFVASFQQTPQVNAQVGTSYTFLASDYGNLVTFNNASAVAVTLPQATGSFSPWNVYVRNLGAGTVTITPQGGSTVGGASTLALLTNQSAHVVSDGTNYQVGFGTGNANLSSMPANTVKCNNTSSSAAPADCTLVALASSATSSPPFEFTIGIGGANPQSSIPNQIAGTNSSLVIAASLADSTSSTAGDYLNATWFSQSGTRPTVAVFGQGIATGASSTVWGGNFDGVANVSGAVGVGVEIDSQASVSGAVANNLSLVSNHTVACSACGYIFIQGNTNNPAGNGIIFNLISAHQPISGSLITAVTGITATNGVDFSAATISGSAFKSNAFSVDGSGNINAAGAFIPAVAGGTLAASTLSLRSTTGVGTTDAIIFQVGNNGGTEAARILDSGVFKMGAPSFAANGTHTMTYATSVAPNAMVTATGPTKWLTFQDSAGVVSYIPVWQ